MLAALLGYVPAQAESLSDSHTADEDFCQSPPAANAELEQRLYELNTDNELDAISKRGYLRALLYRNPNGCSVSAIEKQLLEQFADTRELELKWVYVDNKWDLLPALVADQGDIIIGQHSQFSPASDSNLDYTFTWAMSSSKIVQRADNGHISKLQDLAGRKVAAYQVRITARFCT